MRATASAFCLGLLLVGIAPANDSLNVRCIGSCDTPGAACGVALSGDYAYVADGDSGLRVISVVDPANPAEVGHCETPGNAIGVAVSGSYAYVAGLDSGLRVISIADPAHPVETGYCDTPSQALGLAVVGTMLTWLTISAGCVLSQLPILLIRLKSGTTILPARLWAWLWQETTPTWRTKGTACG